MAGSRKTQYEIAMLVGGQVQASFDNSIHTVNSGFDSLVNIAGSAAKMVTAAFASVQVGQFISDALETYSGFEQSMANTAATANATQMEYNQLEAAAREMGKATTKTAAEASDALGYMMLAGWSVKDSIAGLEPVLRLSEATQMDLATCSDLVTDSMSALGLSVEELGDYLDICTMANNSANTSAQSLMEAFIGCGGAAKSIGKSLGDDQKVLNDTATALGILANNGVKGAEAGTAMNAMLVRMTSKDVAISAMRDLGVSAYDASGNFRGLREVLVDLQGAMAGLDADVQASYMSDIAGTNYYTKMGYLLDAVAESADGAGSAWDTLSGKLEQSDGALLQMADRVTDTIVGARARLESAVDDAKISFADVFADDLKGAINGLSEFIPTLTQKFIDFSAKAGPKISRTFHTITKGAGEAWDVISQMGGWVIDNFDTVEMVIAGIGGAIITYKVISGLAGVAGAIKGIGTALKTMTVSNVWLLGITMAATAIAGVATAIKAAEKQAVESNLQEHFGSIALSMEEMSQVAEHIVMSDNLMKIQEALSAFGELDGIQRSMEDSIKAINKMNWKVSIGMELSGDEVDSYKEEIANYVAQAQEYVLQEQYAINLNLSAFADGDAGRQDIVAKLNSFYTDSYQELQRLGKDLGDAVTEAFADEFLDVEEAKEIAELQAQMARIQEAVATSDYDAQLQIMEFELAGGDLDAESFQGVQEKIGELSEAAAAQYKESLAKNLSAAKQAYAARSLTDSEYNTAVDDFWQDYLDNMTELEAKGAKFQLNTIMQQYSGEVDAFRANMDEVMAEFADEAKWKENPALMMNTMVESLYDNGISKDAKQAIAILLESMQPSIARMEDLKKQYEDFEKEIPDSIQETLANVELLSAMTAYDSWSGTHGDVEAVLEMAKGQIIKDADYKEIEQTLRGYGWELPEAVAKELKTSQTETIAPAINEMYAYSSEYLNKQFSHGFDVSADVNVNLNPVFTNAAPANMAADTNSVKPTARSAARISKHADGGIFSTPHLAWFAEEGPEAAIPIDGSSNAIALWEQVGKLLGVLDGGMERSSGEELYSRLSGGSVADDNRPINSDTMQLVYSPHLTITGNAERDDVEAALWQDKECLREALPEILEEYFAERNRRSFG